MKYSGEVSTAGEIIEDDDEFDSNTDDYRDDDQAESDPEYNEICWCKSEHCRANGLLQ